jgi:hypothetical protein
VDHDWIRQHLGWSVRAEDPITVRSISQSGDLMGSVHRVSCAGRSFIFKGPPPHPAGAWGRLAVETDLVGREVRAYRLLRDGDRTASKVAPQCYWSALGPSGRGALALEDLGAADEQSRTMASGLTLAQARAAIRCLATVHRATGAVRADPLAPPYPWLYSPSSDGLIAAIRLGLDDLPELVAARWPKGLPGVVPERIAAADVKAVLRRAHVGAGYVCVCHGDAWAGNVLFQGSERGSERGTEQGTERGSERPTAFLIDWQFAMWGNPLSDVALLMWSSLTPRCRQAWRDELVGHYHETLRAQRSLDYPLAACHDDVRRAEPAAALIVLATVEAYTSGMGRGELSRLAVRLSAAADRIARADDDASP